MISSFYKKKFSRIMAEISAGKAPPPRPSAVDRSSLLSDRLHLVLIGQQRANYEGERERIRRGEDQGYECEL